MSNYEKPKVDFQLNNFISGAIYSNRYNCKWTMRKIKENMYSLEHEDLTYCRFGGKQRNSGLFHEDLGFVDPSGGPFLSVEGFTIDDKLVSRIYCEGDSILFNTEDLISEKQGGV